MSNFLAKDVFDLENETMLEFELRILPNSNNLCDNCRIIFALIWLFLVVTSLIGNGLIIFTIIKFNKLTNVTQCYLFNLAITDIAFIISCVPLTTYSYLNESWKFGNFVCKGYHYLSFVTVCATCLTLMMMTIDRCCYVCNTKKSKWRNSMFVLYITLSIWIVSFILSIPNFITYNVEIQSYVKEQNSTHFTYEIAEECVQKPDYFWSNFTQWYSIVVSYLLPSLVLIISYIKILHFMATQAKNLALTSVHNGKVSMYRKKKVTKTVVFLTLNFMLLWFPVHFLATWYRLDKNFPEHFSFYFLKMIAHTMSYANSSINPIIYAFLNESFRDNITSLFREIFKQKDYGNIANSNFNNNINNSKNIKKNNSNNELTALF